jgi:hypothetical protein
MNNDGEMRGHETYPPKNAAIGLKENLELNAFGQAEFWKVPVLASGQQHDFTGSFQLTYFPKLSWYRLHEGWLDIPKLHYLEQCATQGPDASRPGGPSAKRQPSPEGLGLESPS